MTSAEAKKIIRQRTNPSIFDFCYITTRAHRKQFLTFKARLKGLGRPVRIIDIGCGQKPFLNLLNDLPIEKYVGVDFDAKRSIPDIIAPVDELPLENDYFDAVIATEVYEHTPRLEKAIAEMRRVMKNDALAYISTPFIFPEHGTPYDFQRITRYKYYDLFKNDEILLLRETNSSLATPFFLMNVVWENIAVIKSIPIIPSIIYFCNNVSALLGEAVVGFIRFGAAQIFPRRRDWLKKLLHSYFSTMPGGFDLIVRIKK